MKTDLAASLIAAIVMGVFIALLTYAGHVFATYRCEQSWQGNSRVQAVEYTFTAQCRIKIDGQWLPEKAYRLTE